MSTRPPLPLEGHRADTTGPHAAGPAALRPAVGEPKGAARQGVRTALRPGPQQGDGRHIVAVLHISAPYGATPTATSKCRCGWDRSAIGHKRVHALIDAHTDHRENCPLRNPQEGRTAA